ncbi:MAG: tRNA glutamyl-Q(34) synthetase GluQRS, partial [Lachnospiraceae bacterium]|nr:tRNA glutamyl-Q(34) synthetase GluQRS [Lachnospiraceae bacterium]
MSHSIIGRYAPSPSGRLHMGNIMSSLLAWLDVRSQDGKLIFRLEDLDPDRSDYDYAALMADDLQ